MMDWSLSKASIYGGSPKQVKDTCEYEASLDYYSEWIPLSMMKRSAMQVNVDGI